MGSALNGPADAVTDYGTASDSLGFVLLAAQIIDGEAARIFEVAKYRHLSAAAPLEKRPRALIARR